MEVWGVAGGVIKEQPQRGPIPIYISSVSWLCARGLWGTVWTLLRTRLLYMTRIAGLFVHIEMTTTQLGFDPTITTKLRKIFLPIQKNLDLDKFITIRGQRFRLLK
jgi:hypothetical protein